MWPVEYNAYGPANTRVILRPNGAKDYAIADHLGSVRLLLGDNGMIKEQRSYGPFGEDLISDGNGARTSYIGRETDTESNLGFFGVRLYDPTYGRFMSVDPLWAKYAPLQPYHYAGNEPVGRLDWDGRDIIALIDWEGANGNGHAAVLIGSEEDGWEYFSKDGGKYLIVGESDDDIRHFESLAEFVKEAKTKDFLGRYDNAFLIPTTKKEDQAAKKAAKEAAKSTYYVVGASCSDVLRDAVLAAGKKAPYVAIPNELYKNIEYFNPNHVHVESEVISDHRNDPKRNLPRPQSEPKSKQPQRQIDKGKSKAPEGVCGVQSE